MFSNLVRYNPFVLLLFYFIIFFEAKFKVIGKLRYGYSNAGIPHKHLEYRILYQSILTSGVLIIEIFAFLYLPKFDFTKQFKVLTNVVTLLVMVALTFVHAIIILVFNGRIRKLFKDIFR